MPVKFIIALGLLSLVLLEALFFSLCRSRRRDGAKQPARPLAFILLNLIVLLLLVAGGMAEQRWETGSRVLRAFQEATRPAIAESFEPTGDPGLLQRVGNPDTTPPRPDFSTPSAFRTWQQNLRGQLLERFDLDPLQEVEVVVRTERTEQLADGVTRSFIVFEASDGTAIPAYLMKPAGSLPGPGPAVLVLPGHPNPSYESGIQQTAGLSESYQRSAALELARAGFVTLTFEFRGFGYLGAEHRLEHRYIAFNALLSGSFYKALIVKDIYWAVQALRSFEEVDPQRIGITGISLGGEVAVTYGALDETIRAVAFQSAFGDVGPVPGQTGVSKKLQPHYCHIVPGHNALLHQEDWLLLIAGRHLLGVRGADEKIRRDWTWPPDELPPATPVVRRAYELLGVAKSFDYRILERSDYGLDRPGVHYFYLQPILDFFDTAL